MTPLPLRIDFGIAVHRNAISNGTGCVSLGAPTACWLRLVFGMQRAPPVRWREAFSSTLWTIGR